MFPFQLIYPPSISRVPPPGSVLFYELSFRHPRFYSSFSSLLPSLTSLRLWSGPLTSEICVRFHKTLIVFVSALIPDLLPPFFSKVIVTYDAHVRNLCTKQSHFDLYGFVFCFFTFVYPSRRLCSPKVSGCDFFFHCPFFSFSPFPFFTYSH